MKCDKCNQDLMVSSCKPNSELNTTVVTMNQVLVCTNPRCDIYCGEDISKPLHIAKKINHKLED